MTGKRAEKRGQRGLTLMELLAYIMVFSILVVLILTFYPAVQRFLDKQKLSSEFSKIYAGLQEYASVHGNYPADDFETWTPNGEYIDPAVWRGKWTYACDNTAGEITITSPPIQDVKVRTQLAASFQKNCNGGVDDDGTYLTCRIFNVYCPATTAP